MDRITLNRKHIISMYRDKQNLNAELSKPFGLYRNYDVIYTILHRNKKLFKQLGITDAYGWRIFENIDSNWRHISNHQSVDELTLLRL